MFNWERFSRVTNDGFFLAIEARDPRFTRKRARASCWNKPAASISPSCTRTKYAARLSSSSLSCAAIAIVAVFGFRGQKSTGRRSKFFPTWCDNRKCARRRRSIFCRWTRSASAGRWHGAVGYEMPTAADRSARRDARGGDAPDAKRTCVSVSAPEPIITTPARWATNWGTGIPLPVTRELMERGQQRFNINCAVCHGADCSRQWDHEAIRPGDRGHACRTIAFATCLTARFSTPSPTAKTR